MKNLVTVISVYKETLHEFMTPTKCTSVSSAE